MVDYFYAPTVMQQTIPNADMTPLERFLLTRMFNAAPDGDGLYFYAPEGPVEMLDVNRTEVAAALAASLTADSEANHYITEQLSHAPGAVDNIQLDMTGTSWEFFVKNIVRRSPTLRYVTVIISFMCTQPKQRDGFGGMAVLITGNSIMGKSTNDILSDMVDELEDARLVPVSGPGVHFLLRLSEQDVRAEIHRLAATDKYLASLGPNAISDDDIRAGCLVVAER
jgi:hypothetical protein